MPFTVIASWTVSLHAASPFVCNIRDVTTVAKKSEKYTEKLNFQSFRNVTKNERNLLIQ